MVAGLLLTGGLSRRMGREKSLLRLGDGGAPLAEWLGQMLSEVSAPAIEVGPGRSALAVASETDPCEGPLGGIAAGARSLRLLGADTAALVVATDLPLMRATFLGRLARWPAPPGISVVPVVDGRLQPLCARWSARDLWRAVELFGAGERRVQAALSDDALRLVEADFPDLELARLLSDVDEEADLERLGLFDRPG